MQLNQLLVVIDPTSKESQPALQRAQWLALKSQAKVELLICDYHSALDNTLFGDHSAQHKARAALLAEHLNWLEELAQPLREQGTKVTTQVRWGKVLYQEIIAHAKALKPDVLLRNATTHGLFQRLFFSNTSWQLIRFCPLPVWLVRDTPWNGNKLAAALDPTHTDDKAASLDHQLIKTTQALAETLGMQANYVHSYNTLPSMYTFEAEVVISYDVYLKSIAELHEQSFNTLLDDYAIDNEQRKLLSGAPEHAIPQYINSQSIDLLVMGAISRSQVENALIGNTAERILENSTCDLLVVKPLS